MVKFHRSRCSCPINLWFLIAFDDNIRSPKTNKNEIKKLQKFLWTWERIFIMRSRLLISENHKISQHFMPVNLIYCFNYCCIFLALSLYHVKHHEINFYRTNSIENIITHFEAGRCFNFFPSDAPFSVEEIKR